MCIKVQKKVYGIYDLFIRHTLTWELDTLYFSSIAKISNPKRVKLKEFGLNPGGRVVSFGIMFVQESQFLSIPKK